MPYPQNPETIVIQNNFYKHGLTELDTWNYYQKVKIPILKETRNKDLMFVIMTDINQPVIKRKTQGDYIRLTPQNYDTFIIGRTISIHSSMGMYENYGILDIDIDPSDGFKWAVDATKRVYDFVMDKMPIVRTASIRFTGKSSFHIQVEFARKMKVDAIKFLLEKFLRSSDLSRIYSVGGKRRPGVPNIDLNRNCLRCNHITLNSLSVLGLRCMEVPYNKLSTFDPRMAVIK